MKDLKKRRINKKNNLRFHKFRIKIDILNLICNRKPLINIIFKLIKLMMKKMLSLLNLFNKIIIQRIIFRIKI